MVKLARTRVNIRFPTDLLNWSKSFVRKRNTSITQAIVDHFTELKLKEERNVAKQQNTLTR